MSRPSADLKTEPIPNHWEELRSGHAGQVSCRLFQVTVSNQSDYLFQQ